MQNFIAAKTVRQLAAKLFPGNDVQSFIQRQRPRICPFEKLLCLIPPNASLLDLGCGSGLFLGLAAELDLISSALGIDRRQQVIATAKEMKRRINYGRGKLSTRPNLIRGFGFLFFAARGTVLCWTSPFV